MNVEDIYHSLAISQVSSEYLSAPYFAAYKIMPNQPD